MKTFKNGYLKNIFFYEINCNKLALRKKNIFHYDFFLKNDFYYNKQTQNSFLFSFK